MLTLYRCYVSVWAVRRGVRGVTSRRADGRKRQINIDNSMQIQFNIDEAKSALNSIDAARFNERTGLRLTVKGMTDARNGARAAIGQLTASAGNSSLSGGKAIRSREDGVAVGYRNQGSVRFTLDTAEASAPLLFDCLVTAIVSAEKASLASGYAGFKVGIPTFAVNGKLADWLANFEQTPVVAHDVSTGGEQLSMTGAPAATVQVSTAVSVVAPVKGKGKGKGSDFGPNGNGGYAPGYAPVNA